MKTSKYLILPFLSVVVASSLLASESKDYPYITPISVEVAPNSHVEIKPSNEETEVDLDKDGVIDEVDRCLNTQIGIKVDKYGCKIRTNPEKITDTDNDGVQDSDDKCPGTSFEHVVDEFGCPTIYKPKLNFASSSYALTDEIKEALVDFIEFLKDNNEYLIVIYGYTDNSGDAQKNRTLSQNRANAIRDLFLKNGIKSSRLTSIGMGGKDPIADNDTKEGRAKNRRINFEIIR